LLFDQKRKTPGSGVINRRNGCGPTVAAQRLRPNGCGSTVVFDQKRKPFEKNLAEKLGFLYKVCLKKRREKMVQTVAAMEAYNAHWANSFIPRAEILWIILILILAVIALWQARTFVSKF
jgi:hypothetical protein